MITVIDPTVDYAFKQLFGREVTVALAIDLLNAVLGLKPGKAVRELAILNPFTEKEFAEGKVSVFDVKGKDQAGRYHHIEMQRLVPWYFPKRVLYYWATSHGQQMLQGDDYVTVQPTFLVCILGEKYLDDTDYHHKFQVIDPDHGVVFWKDLEIHTVELSKFTLPVELVKSPLERWCYFLAHGAELDTERLPAQLDVPEIRQAMEVLMRLSQDELDRYRYLDQLQAQRDEASRKNAVASAREFYRQEGRDEGRDEGEEKGVLMGEFRALQKVLKQPVTPREELKRLTVEELTARLAELEKKAFPDANGTA